jgi:hypothetical protein
MSTIDDQIRGLFDKLAARKTKIESLQTEIAKSWKTTGTFRLIGAVSPTNIQTANTEQIIDIATNLAIVAEGRSSALNLLGRSLDVVKVQGYSVQDWVDDFKKRLATIDIREEQAQLESIEQRLTQVLSPEERRRIEVELLMKELDDKK